MKKTEVTRMSKGKSEITRTSKGDAMLAALVTGGGQHYIREVRSTLQLMYSGKIPNGHPASGTDEELREYLIHLLLSCRGSKVC